MRPTRIARLGSVLALALLAAACASAPVGAPGAIELGRNAYVAVEMVGRGDTAESLARRLVGDASMTNRIIPVGKAGAGPLAEGDIVAVALRPLDPGGVLSGPARRVPILCYHRFTENARSGSRMEVTAAAFEAQLRYLRDNGYSVIPLARLRGFLDGIDDLPPKPVVITIDDGYRSAYALAFPVLKRFEAPATLFVYSDFIGSRSALTWDELKSLGDSGLIDVQAHSKSHGDLTRRLAGESEAAYRRRVAVEFAAPRKLLDERAGAKATAFAYPYGAANAVVLEQARTGGWSLAVTVLRGGNTTWTPPLLLRRDMVFGDEDLAAFGRKVAQAGRGARGE